MVPIYSVVSLASYLFWVRISGFHTEPITHGTSNPRIILRPYYSFVTAMSPRCLPHSSIYFSRIFPPIPSNRKMCFVRYVCAYSSRLLAEASTLGAHVRFSSIQVS